MELKEHLGKRVADKISGFNGTVTAYSGDIDGIEQLLITANGVENDREPIERWFSVSRVMPYVDLDGPAAHEAADDCDAETARETQPATSS